MESKGAMKIIAHTVHAGDSISETPQNDYGDA
jgi:hypothetical protein